MNGGTAATVAKTDYAANAGSNVWSGTGPTASCNAAQYPNCASFETSDSGWNVDPKDNGISSHRTEVKPASIIDGTSNTVFAGEKYMNAAQYTTGTAVSDDFNAYTGCDPNGNRWVPGITGPPGNPPPPTNTSATTPTQDILNVDGTPDNYDFGSAHSGSFNVVFCDGSVRSVSYSIDLKTWACLGIRNDQVPHDDLP